MANGYLDKVTSLVDDIISEKNKKAKEKAKSKNEVSEYTAEKQELDRITMTKTIMSTISILDDEEAKKVLEIIQSEVINEDIFVDANGSLDLEGFKNELKVIVSDNIDVSKRNDLGTEDTTQNNLDLETKVEEDSKKIEVEKNFEVMIKNFDYLSDDQIFKILDDFPKLSLAQQKEVESKILGNKQKELLKQTKDPVKQEEIRKEIKKFGMTLKAFNDGIEEIMHKCIIGEEIDGFVHDSIDEICKMFYKKTLAEVITEIREENKSKEAKTDKHKSKEDKDKNQSTKTDNNKTDESINMLDDPTAEEMIIVMEKIKSFAIQKFHKIKTIENLVEFNRDAKEARKVMKMLKMASDIDKIVSKFIRDDPVHAQKMEDFKSQFDYMSFLRNEHKNASYEEFEKAFTEAGMGGLLTEIESKVPLEKIFNQTRAGFKQTARAALSELVENEIKRGSFYNKITKGQNERKTIETGRLAPSPMSTLRKKHKNLKLENIDSRGIFDKDSRDEDSIESESNSKLFGTEDLKEIAEEIKTSEVKTVLGKIKDRMSLRKHNEEKKTKQALSTDDNDQEIGE